MQPEARVSRGLMTELGESAKRQRSLMIIVLILMIIFAGRLVYVQGITGPALAQAGQNLRINKAEEIYAPRGDILDATGMLLATTVETYDIRVDLRQIPDYRIYDEGGDPTGYGALAAADRLIDVLGVPGGKDRETHQAELAASLVGENGWHLIAANVAPKL